MVESEALIGHGGSWPIGRGACVDVFRDPASSSGWTHIYYPTAHAMLLLILRCVDVIGAIIHRRLDENHSGSTLIARTSL